MAEYLAGGTGTFTHPLPRTRRVRDRDVELLSLIRGRRTAHIGCTDAPFTEAGLASGSLLHQHVIHAASASLGVDIDVEGLRTLEQRLGGDYSSVDLSSDGPNLSEILQFRPEVLLLADVIEHVGDAQRFLTNVGLVAASASASVVLSTPNALSARSFILTAFGLEMVHPDHVAIYSPRTLKTLAARAGLGADSWITYNVTTGHSVSRRLFDATVSAVSAVRPGYGEGLIVVLRPG